MLELFHAVIASLLLSAAVGCGGDRPSARDEDQTGSETGIDIEKAQPPIAIVRSGPEETQADADGEHVRILPVAIAPAWELIQPQPAAALAMTDVQRPCVPLLRATSGRSP